MRQSYFDPESPMRDDVVTIIGGLDYAVNGSISIIGGNGTSLLPETETETEMGSYKSRNVR